MQKEIPQYANKVVVFCNLLEIRSLERIDKKLIKRHKIDKHEALWYRVRTMPLWLEKIYPTLDSY